MSYKKKYKPGRLVTSLEDFRQLTQSFFDEPNYFYFSFCPASVNPFTSNLRPNHVGWVMSMSFHTIDVLITMKGLWLAEKVEEKK